MFHLHNISKKYDNDKVIIFNNLNFKFNQQGLYIILGSSGSGKTTLLNLLNHKCEPDEGIIESKDNITIGNIYQNIQLIQYYTVYENLLLALDCKDMNLSEKRKYIMKYLKKFHLSDCIDKKVNYLSGGEQQRIAIIRALLIDCDVLLCDEPTSYLDIENSLLVFQMLKEISQDKLVIVATHNQKLAIQYADYLLKIKNHHIEILKDKEDNNYYELKIKDNLKKINFNSIMRDIFTHLKRLKTIYMIKIICTVLIIVSMTFCFILLNQSNAIVKSTINDFNGYDTLIFNNYTDKTETYSIYDILKICELDENIIGYRFDLNKDWPFGIGVEDSNIKVLGNEDHSWWHIPHGKEVFYCDNGFDNLNEYKQATGFIYEMKDMSRFEVICGTNEFKGEVDAVLSIPVADYLLKRYSLDDYNQLINKEIEIYTLTTLDESNDINFPMTIKVVGIVNYNNDKYKKIFMSPHSYSRLLCNVYEFNTNDMEWYNVEIMVDSRVDTLTLRNELNEKIKDLYPKAHFTFNDEVINISTIEIFSSLNTFIFYGIIVCSFIFIFITLIYISHYELKVKRLELKIKEELRWSHKNIKIQFFLENVIVSIISLILSIPICIMILNQINKMIINISEKIQMENTVNLFHFQYLYHFILGITVIIILELLYYLCKRSEE